MTLTANCEKMLLSRNVRKPGGDRASCFLGAIMRKVKPPDPWNSATGHAVRRRCWVRDKQRKAPCHICEGRRGPIDYDAKPSSTPLSWEPDHIKPRSRYPELTLVMSNIGPSHKVCNREKGSKLKQNDLGTPSRDWN